MAVSFSDVTVGRKNAKPAGVVSHAVVNFILAAVFTQTHVFVKPLAVSITATNVDVACNSSYAIPTKIT